VAAVPSGLSPTPLKKHLSALREDKRILAVRPEDLNRKNRNPNFYEYLIYSFRMILNLVFNSSFKRNQSN
jgi:hypothetical protein